MPNRTFLSRRAISGCGLPCCLMILLGALFAGCQQMPESLRNRLPATASPRVRVFSADTKITFAAARAALDQMGYRFTGGGPAQGRLTAMSAITPGDWPGSSHQFKITAEFHPAIDSPGTEVSVRMTELIEEESVNHAGQGAETVLQDTPLVEVFFDGIQQNLPPPQKSSP